MRKIKNKCTTLFNASGSKTAWLSVIALLFIKPMFLMVENPPNLRQLGDKAQIG